MWLMLKRDEPGDYVIGTGVQSSVRNCFEIAFGCFDLDPADFVKTDKALQRPAEVDTLLADPSKAERELGWKANTSFRELIELMVQADLEAQEKLSGRRQGGPGTR
jgi:GDPmannose 4,6-dehydratase